MAEKDGPKDTSAPQPGPGPKSPFIGAPGFRPGFGAAGPGAATGPGQPPAQPASDPAKGAGATPPFPFPELAARAPELKASVGALGRFGRDALDRLNKAGGPPPQVPKARERTASPAGSGEQGQGPRWRRGLIVFAVGAVLVYLAARDNVPGVLTGARAPDAFLIQQLGKNLVAAIAGLILGLVPVLLMTRLRDIGVALAGLVLLYFILLPVYGTGMVFFTGAAAVIGGVMLGLKWFGEGLAPPDTFGTSRWAKKADLDAAGLTGEEGYRLGTFTDGKEETLIRYAGQRHLLTVAPTRAGKGVSAIIPNLLTYRGSALVIDPKGENALLTAKRRKALGQGVHLIDPWGIAAPTLGLAAARFNPLDMLKADDPDLVENAVLIADALVVGGEGKDRFWDDEARAFLVGMILWVATAPEEAKSRTLGRVRDLLMLDAEEMAAQFEKMIAARHPAVNAAGTRAMQKEEKLLSNVLATVQSHTNMLDSPRIRESLSGSDVRFETLKTAPVTIYLILPADRLDTYGRWLRLLVQQAIVVNARNVAAKPKRPILFLLDEMAALGRLAMVEQAYGLMAGFGMQLWGIVQDLSQLKRLYGDGWETFVGNAGVLQYFGSRDRMTAEYFSALCGVTTVWNISTAISTAVGASENRTTSAAQRPLIFPDELMTLRGERQLLLIENGYPVIADKTPWFQDQELKRLADA